MQTPIDSVKAILIRNPLLIVGQDWYSIRLASLN